jgi:hypothetical protein
MLYALLVGRKRKKKRERNVQEAFFPWPVMSHWLCCAGFSQLLCAIKS